MRLNKWLVAAGAGTIVVLLLVVAFLAGTRSAAPDKDVQQGANIVEAADTPRITKAAAPHTVATKRPLISACYHLESCNVWRLLDIGTVKQEQGKRLVKASLQLGDVRNSEASEQDEKNVTWQAGADTFYALCSTSTPLIAWEQDGKYTAEEFDFGGEGVPGVQQDNANIYGALCHGFYKGELAEKARSLGYRPLKDGGRGQFEIDSPKQLLAGS